MFGYLTAAQGLLEPAQLERYKACYCGLCRSLKERHGQLSRLTLNYDMTFLVLLLSSLYEPEEETGEKGCIAHPFKPGKWWQSGMTAYAADMNVALAYLKCRDDWSDDADPVALAEAGLLKKAYRDAKTKYPRQCAAMERCMEKLGAVEGRGEDAPDEASACFGELMGEVFVLYDDRWSDTLRRMGDALGRFIYIMDACMDLEKDVQYARYNPFSTYCGCGDNEKRFRDILKMLLGECVYRFDLLPLVQDVGLMKNILCAGLWAEFDKKYTIQDRKEDRSDVSGPV